MLLGALVLMVLRLLEQSDEHVKTVKGMKVKFAKTQFQPGIDETTAELQRDLKADPNRKQANYRNLELNERSFKLIARMKHLSSLELNDCVFDPSYIRYLERLPLSKLDLSGNDIGDQAMTPVGKIKTLTTLKFADTKCSGKALEICKELTNLQVFEVNGLSVHDEDLKWIENCPIVDLNIAGTKVTDAGCDSIAKLVTLMKLDVSRTKITGAGLARLKTLVNLDVLRIRDCKLNDTDLALFAQFPRLRTLHLNKSDISDKGIMALGKSNSLRMVEIVNSPNVTKAGVEKFSKTYKKMWLKVTSEVSGFSRYAEFLPEN